MHGIKLGQAFGRKVQEIPAYDELHHPKKALGQCMTLVGKDGPNRTCEAEQSGHVSEKINLLFLFSFFSLLLEREATPLPIRRVDNNSKIRCRT